MLDPPFYWGGRGGGLSFPCPRGVRLPVRTALLSRLLGFLLLLAGVSLLSLPVFADGSGWLADGPWFSSLHCWAPGGVALFFWQGPVVLPYSGFGDSGFLGPEGFGVFAMGSPVSGRACVLPPSSIVTKTFPPFGGFGSGPSCWQSPASGKGCVLWPAMVPEALTPYSRFDPATSPWVPLLGASCV